MGGADMRLGPAEGVLERVTGSDDMMWFGEEDGGGEEGRSRFD